MRALLGIRKLHDGPRKIEDGVGCMIISLLSHDGHMIVGVMVELVELL
jgi:hypothetical protein